MLNLVGNPEDLFCRRGSTVSLPDMLLANAITSPDALSRYSINILNLILKHRLNVSARI